jgi:hypothetical protein
MGRTFGGAYVSKSSMKTHRCQSSPETPPGGESIHWLENDNLDKLERAWINIHIDHKGIVPILNRVYSPVSV